MTPQTRHKSDRTGTLLATYRDLAIDDPNGFCADVVRAAELILADSPAVITSFPQTMEVALRAAVEELRTRLKEATGG